jgi:hypothetical protein
MLAKLRFQGDITPEASQRVIWFIGLHLLHLGLQETAHRHGEISTASSQPKIFIAMQVSFHKEGYMVSEAKKHSICPMSARGFRGLAKFI